MLRNRGIAFKLLGLILSGSGIIFLLMFGYSYWFTRGIIVKDVEEQARNLSMKTVNHVEAVLAPLEQIPRNIARVVENSTLGEQQIYNLLTSAVRDNQDAYGACLAFEPNSFDKNRKFFAAYASHEASGETTEISTRNIGMETYNYFGMDWYQIPRETNQACWLDPYFDEGGGDVLMTTYSVPFRQQGASGAGEFQGIATTDIRLDWLSESVSSMRILRTGFAFLVSGSGMFMTHPRREFVMNETIFSLADARGDKDLRTIGRLMLKGQMGFVPTGTLVPGKRCWLFYAPISRTGWSLGVVYPEDELMADVAQLRRIGLEIGGAGLTILFLVTLLIARGFARPLRELALATKGIAAGDLECVLPQPKSGDEIGSLTRSFISMQASLKEYIRNLKETTAAKERIESELQIAHEIQMSILPKIFPPFPHCKEFELFAELDPAKEVGGDFYDFVVTDRRQVWFAIGDVSGKGVPASLFMAVTKTLLKSIASAQGNTAEILTQLNRDLCQDNDSGMFVTLFFGIMDLETGEIEYANGGHNPPYFVGQDGSVKMLLEGKGRALGVLDDSTYRSARIVLPRGDSLFLYTDGVTEAMNLADELFSNKRLEDCLKRAAGLGPRELVPRVVAEVREYAGPAPQSDDITAMALRYVVPPED